MENFFTFLFHIVASKRPYFHYGSSYQLLVFTNVFAIYQAITMIYRGHLIDKMANIYKKIFPVISKEKIYRFIASGVLLLFNSVVIDV